jgi:hypothetical protein
MGDGLLLDAHPQHVYTNLPNVVELSIPVLLLLGCRAFATLWLVELISEAYYAWHTPLSTHLSPWMRMRACFYAAIVKNVVDVGHAVYFLRKGRLDMLCRRFDWFAAVSDGVIIGERQKFAIRFALWVLVGCLM